MEGKVKWFNSRKGYGFVQGDDGEEYFVHSSALQGTRFLRENDRVSFEAAESEKGKQAQNVQLLKKGSDAAAESPAEEESSEEDYADQSSEEEASEDEEPQED